MRNIVFGFVIGLLLFAGVAFASSDGITGGIVEGSWPEGVDVWTVDGRIFVRDAVTGELVWFCEGGCKAVGVCPFITTPEVTPDVTPPAETPTPPVDPTPTPNGDPTKEAKAPCNRGVGNSGNECDPGNSFEQGQGDGRPAGEDRDENDTGPGNSGGNGNQNDRNK